jgi:hypothetical protein
MLAAILNEDTWRSPNPLAVILQGAGEGAKTGAKIGGGLGTAFPAIQAGVRGIGGIGKPAATPGSTAPHDADPSAQPPVPDAAASTGDRDHDAEETPGESDTETP